MKGLDESFESQDDILSKPIITKEIVIFTKAQLDHLMCPICLQIIWKPVTCGSMGCYSTFCQSCISSWIHSNNEQESMDIEESVSRNKKGCPKCKRPFKPINIPLLSSLLDCLVLRCPNHKVGCNISIDYRNFQSHIDNCGNRQVKCTGCRQSIKKMEQQQHMKQCQYVEVSCLKCNLKTTRGNFQNIHTNENCIDKRVANQVQKLESVSVDLDQFGQRMSSLQQILKKLIRAESISLKIQFHTTFSQNFSFPNPTLIKPSFNHQKEKFDFLHFYLVNPIRTAAPINVKWRMRVNKLTGNLLLGFCSSMNMNSLDYIINKFGEIKRKEPNQNKYRPVRKSFFEFLAGDIINFEYRCSSQWLLINNETQNLQIQLDTKETQDIGATIYCFYSMDTLYDSVSFLQ